ncbi:radical SAM family heme chaperone HemW [Chitinimonas koreensis]|uniref:radical SAM family heme chaperone HemW n=1 Tax=Chitinimonas koreensis TaxID=356302 RepID=UPI0003F7BD0A|nr:radical SAM family heme chaperone HemW [Chitinimonas koreensis]QNM96429.1 oxygen-independent coproporphyrinogen III oxidase-like protein [Chitinimonas koreensis]
MSIPIHPHPTYRPAAIQPIGRSHWQLDALPPLSLYIHFPWCVRKCPYCDFNSHEAKTGFDEAGYVEALLRDLEHSLPLIWGRPVHTVFMGGGTPSLFSPAAMETLLAGLRARLKLLPDAEITLEANPGTVEAAKFEGYRAAGINRLSIGIQSFDPGHLQAIGRIHDADEARRAAALARDTFDTFNLDLMFALPGQTLAQALADVETALSFSPTHLSCYHLTLEPNTWFYRHPPELPDDDAAAEMHDAIEARLAAAGFEHYETSAYARPGHAARHNLNYWRFGDYLGIGAGAHGKLSFHDRIIRQARYKQPAAYLKAVAAGNAVQSEDVLGHDALPFEFMLNALRLAEGFAVPLFRERTGLPLNVIEKPLLEAERLGLIERDHQRIRPSERGRRYQNQLLQLFLPA